MLSIEKFKSAVNYRDTYLRDPKILTLHILIKLRVQLHNMIRFNSIV